LKGCDVTGFSDLFTTAYSAATLGDDIEVKLSGIRKYLL